MFDAQEVIKKLGLMPLPDEGGYFRETFRSERLVEVNFGSGIVSRSAGTEILYLITPDQFSALHRIKSDEVFHFYLGDPVEMIQLHARGELKRVILGDDIFEHQTLQAHVPANTWQGSRLLPGGRFALLGTSVFPGFEFSDFELGARQPLGDEWPRYRREIDLLTRDDSRS
jgi:predicted cupin superfamily sugar epimerase